MNAKLIIITALLLCIAIPACSAGTVVDEDLVWSSSGSSFDTGGGFELYEADRTDISGENISLETGVIQGYNPDFTGSVDYSLYDRARFSLWGLEYEVPFDYLASENNVVLAGVYAVAPSGTMYSNVDWGYSDAYYNGSVAYAFGFPGFDNAVNIPVTLLGNGTEIIQHVTVTDTGGIFPGYSVLLERNDVYSEAVVTIQNFESGTPSYYRNDGSDDMTYGVFAYQGPFTLDVTINGETKSVSWGGSEPTPTVTPTPTPTIPTNISNVTNPLDLKEPWDPDILPRPPDPGDLRLPDHIPGLDGLEDLLQNIRNSSTTHFPLYNSSFHSFADKIDDTRSLLVTSVTNFIAVLFSPIYFVIGIITNGIVFLTRVLGGFAAYLIVPGMVFNAVFRIIPGFILNIISIFILLDGIFFILRTILPSLRTKGGT